MTITKKEKKERENVYKADTTLQGSEYKLA